MSPKRLAGPAYRAAAGEVIGRTGRPLPASALRLLQFYGREAEARRQAGESAAARHCAEMAAELAGAIVAANDWRRAAGRGCEADLAMPALRALAAEAKRLAPG